MLHIERGIWWDKISYGEDAPSHDVVKDCHRQFKHSGTSVETDQIPGRPQSIIDDATIEQVEASILEDRSIKVRQLAHEVKISVRYVEKIIYDYLHMGKVSARWIPRLLTPW